MFFFKGKLTKVRVAGATITLSGILIMFLTGEDGHLVGWLGNLGLVAFAVGLTVFYLGVANEDDPSWKSDREKKIKELERRIQRLESDRNG